MKKGLFILFSLLMCITLSSCSILEEYLGKSRSTNSASPSQSSEVITSSATPTSSTTVNTTSQATSAVASTTVPATSAVANTTAPTTSTVVSTTAQASSTTVNTTSPSNNNDANVLNKVEQSEITDAYCAFRSGDIYYYYFKIGKIANVLLDNPTYRYNQSAYNAEYTFKKTTITTESISNKLQTEFNSSISVGSTSESENYSSSEHSWNINAKVSAEGKIFKIVKLKGEISSGYKGTFVNSSKTIDSTTTEEVNFSSTINAAEKVYQYSLQVEEETKYTLTKEGYYYYGLTGVFDVYKLVGYNPKTDKYSEETYTELIAAGYNLIYTGETPYFARYNYTLKFSPYLAKELYEKYGRPAFVLDDASQIQGSELADKIKIINVKIYNSSNNSLASRSCDVDSIPANTCLITNNKFSISWKIMEDYIDYIDEDLDPWIQITINFKQDSYLSTNLYNYMKFEGDWADYYYVTTDKNTYEFSSVNQVGDKVILFGSNELIKSVTLETKFFDMSSMSFEI